MRLQIDQIVIEPTVHPRSHTDWRTSYAYYRAMEAGAKFPKIVVTKMNILVADTIRDAPQYSEEFVLIDGYHRLEAYKLAKASEVNVEEIHCKNLDEAFIEAVQRNIAHGKPLDYTEKANIYLRLQGKMREGKIAALLQVTPKELKKIEVNRIRETDSGEKIVVKRALTAVTTLGNMTKEDQHIFTGASQLAMIKGITMIITRGWLDIGNKEVVKAFEVLKAILRKLK